MSYMIRIYITKLIYWLPGYDFCLVFGIAANASIIQPVEIESTSYIADVYDVYIHKYALSSV